MKRNSFIFIGLALIIAFAGYLLALNNGNDVAKENETQDIKELVNHYSTDNIENESASITSHELIVTESDESKVAYDLPEDDFFVSIAPYVKDTHPCATHSLTGCQGEMMNEAFDVYMEDAEGNVILDETVKSQANGFIDLWLPRDKVFSVKITHDGKTVESAFSSFEGDNTCITTMQFKEETV